MKATFIKANDGELIGFPLPDATSPFVTGKNDEWEQEWKEFLEKQEPLGEEFEQVLFNNLYDLLVYT